MKYQNINDPGLKTGVFIKKNLRSGGSVTVYRLRMLTSGNLIDYEDDGAGPSGDPNQARQRLLKGISSQVEIKGKMFPKLVADDSSLGAIDGPGGYPITIPVIDAAMIDAMGKKKEQQKEIASQAQLEVQSTRQEAKPAAKRGRPRKKKDVG